MEPLRIAVLLPHLGVYGGIRRFLELGRVWLDRGHLVTVFTPPSRAEDRPWIPFGGAVRRLDQLDPSSWDALLSPDPALFLEASAPLGPGSLRSAGALRVFYAVLEGAPRAAEAFRSADLVLANSRGMQRHLARRGVRAIDAPGGVDLDVFRPPDPDPRAKRWRRGEPVRVLVYGRLSRRRKGTWTAVRALESAARGCGASVLVTLFDDPPDGSGEPALPRPLSIPHRWALRPSQEALRDLYGDSDLFVSAERRAGWSNTAAEAMACGAAVVCTRSGTEDFALDGATASVSRWPWAWALARKIGPLLRDPGARLAIAARGRERIAAFTWIRTADRIERAIRERMEKRSRHG